MIALPFILLRKDTEKIRVCILRSNKPISGSFSYPGIKVNNGKPRKTFLFSSCGKYAQ
jgi:hypothetical protein